MAYTYNSAGGAFQFGMKSISGRIVTDATAIPTMNITATAGQSTALVVDDNTPFNQNDIIQVNGGGTAGSNQMAINVGTKGTGGSSSTNRIDTRAQRPVITAVGPVAVSPYYKIRTRYRPNVIELFNQTTNYKYEWFREMDENTAYQTTDVGARSFLADSGIYPMAFGFFFHPNLLGTNSAMLYKCQFGPL